MEQKKIDAAKELVDTLYNDFDWYGDVSEWDKQDFIRLRQAIKKLNRLVI